QHLHSLDRVTDLGDIVTVLTSNEYQSLQKFMIVAGRMGEKVTDRSYRAHEAGKPFANRSDRWLVVRVTPERMDPRQALELVGQSVAIRWRPTHRGYEPINR